MKRYIRDAWVALLKSGKYRQGKYKLCVRDGDGYSFCCLGILTEMYQSERRAEGKEPLEEAERAGAVGSTFFYGRSTAGSPPSEVREWAGLDTLHLVMLAHLNDNGASFPQIADYIERKL